MKSETALNCIFCVRIEIVMTSTVRYTYQLSRVLVNRPLLYENPCWIAFMTASLRLVTCSFL